MLVGRDAIALDRVQKASALAHAMTEFSATGDKETLKKRLAVINDDGPAEGEDMGVSVGNTTTITNHYAAPQVTPPTATPQAATPQVEAVKNLGKTVGKYALIAALAGGTSGIGGLVAAYLLKQSIPAPVQYDPNAYDINGSVEPIE